MRNLFTLFFIVYLSMNACFLQAQDVTSTYLTNPSFEDGDLTGWTLTGANGYTWTTPNTDGDATKDGDYVTGVWNNPIEDVEWSQAITGLDNGFYKVGCLMTVSNGRLTSQRLFANDSSMLYGADTDYSAQNLNVLDSTENYDFGGYSTLATENGPFMPLAVVVEVTDGNLTIGARVNGSGTVHSFDFQGAGGDIGFFKFDHFTLFNVDTATIDTIIFSSGSLDTDFDPGVHTYNATLPKLTTKVAPSVVFAAKGITATGLDSVDVSSGTGSSVIEVTCLNGTTRNYTVNYTVLTASDDATLSDLTLDVGTLSPSFSPNNTTYLGLVPVGTDSVAPTATVNDVLASASGDEKIGLINGHGKSEIVVTAENGTTKTYTIYYDYNYLTNPSFETGDLSGWTLTGADGYAWTTPNTDGDATKDGDYVTGVWNDPIGDVEWSQAISGLDNGFYKVGCLMTVSNNRLTSQRLFANDSSMLYGANTDYSAQNLNVLDPMENYDFGGYSTLATENGPFMPLAVVVEVTDGNLTIGARVNGSGTTHAFDFQGAGGDIGFFKFDNFSVSNVSGLLIKSLSIDGNTIDGIDSTDIQLYSMDLPHGTTTVPTVTATAAFGVKVNVIPCTELPGTTEIILSSADSSYSMSYYVHFNTLPSSDATLSNLTTSDGSLWPSFNPASLVYAIIVPSELGSVTLTATASDSLATVEGDGLIDVSKDTTVAIVVTAEDLSTLTYSVNISVIRVQSSDATLSSLTTSVGTLTPVFNSSTLDYSIGVPSGTTSVTLTATANNAFATVEGDGLIELDRDTTVTIVVTAEDLTTSTYSVSISLITSVSTNTLSEISIYPSISSDIFHISGLGKGEMIEVYEMTGRIVQSKVVTSEHEILTIEKSGTYIIKVSNGAQSSSFSSTVIKR
jgi:hypothetical protein